MNGATWVLMVPALAAPLLALLPGYRMSARVNIAASFLTLLAALSLFGRAQAGPSPYVLVDQLNIVFIVLNSLVGFTTSVFSASYIGHELETGRLSPSYLRFYHAMYQVMMFGMSLALLANNIGLMWVAIELATLATVCRTGPAAGSGPRASAPCPWACPRNPRCRSRTPDARRRPAGPGMRPRRPPRSGPPPAA